MGEGESLILSRDLGLGQPASGFRFLGRLVTWLELVTSSSDAGFGTGDLRRKAERGPHRGALSNYHFLNKEATGLENKGCAGRFNQRIA